MLISKGEGPPAHVQLPTNCEGTRHIKPISLKLVEISALHLLGDWLLTHKALSQARDSSLQYQQKPQLKRNSSREGKTICSYSELHGHVLEVVDYFLMVLNTINFC